MTRGTRTREHQVGGELDAGAVLGGGHRCGAQRLERAGEAASVVEGSSAPGSGRPGDGGEAGQPVACGSQLVETIEHLVAPSPAPSPPPSLPTSSRPTDW